MIDKRLQKKNLKNGNIISLKGNLYKITNGTDLRNIAVILCADPPDNSYIEYFSMGYLQQQDAQIFTKKSNPEYFL